MIDLIKKSSNISMEVLKILLNQFLKKLHRKKCIIFADINKIEYKFLYQYAVDKNFEIKKVFHCNFLKNTYEGHSDSCEIEVTKKTLLSGEVGKNIENATSKWISFQEMINFIKNDEYNDFIVLEWYGSLPVAKIFDTCKVAEIHSVSLEESYKVLDLKWYKNFLKENIRGKLNLVKLSNLTGRLEENELKRRKEEIENEKLKLLNLYNKELISKIKDCFKIQKNETFN